MLGRRQPGLRKEAAKGAPLLGEMDRLRAGTDNRYAGVLERLSESQRGLSTKLHDDARYRSRGLFGVHHLQDVLQRQRLEVQPVGGVIVGRDGLGVAVHHDRLVAGPCCPGIDSAIAACTQE